MDKRIALGIIMAVCMLTGCGEWSTRPIDPPDTYTNAPPTPMTVRGARVVASGEAKAFFDRREAFFIDVRHPLTYRDGRIPGASSMPYIGPVGYSEEFHPERSELTMFRLRVDKSTPVIVYGTDSHDWRAFHAARTLAEQGNDFVMWFRGGYEDWVRRGYDVEK